MARTSRRLRLVARLDQVGQATHWAMDLAENQGLGDALRFRIDLVLEEALTNIAKHAYDEGEPGFVEIAWQPGRNDGVILQICDWGHPFDPADFMPAAPAQDLASAQPGGSALV